MKLIPKNIIVTIKSKFNKFKIDSKKTSTAKIFSKKILKTNIPYKILNFDFSSKEVVVNSYKKKINTKIIRTKTT